MITAQGDLGLLVAVVYGVGQASPAEYKATVRAPTGSGNARLIAAAPELLAACKIALKALTAISKRLDDLELPLADIEAVIAKVEG